MALLNVKHPFQESIVVDLDLFKTPAVGELLLQSGYLFLKTKVKLLQVLWLQEQSLVPEDGSSLLIHSGLVSSFSSFVVKSTVLK